MTADEQLHTDHSYCQSVQLTAHVDQSDIAETSAAKISLADDNCMDWCVDSDVDDIVCGAYECCSTETDRPTPVATSSNTQSAHVSAGAADAFASTNTPRKVRYRSVINRMRVRLHRAQKKLRSTVLHRKFTATTDIEYIVKQAESYLPEVTLNFFRSQMYASCCKRAHSMRWSDNDKLLALSIYYHGPKAYRFLSKIFRLPSIQSLRRWIRNLNMKPGFSTEISQILSKKFSRMTQLSKYCVLTFDEMSIKTAIRYDSASDCFVGMEDYGSVGGRGKGLASQALVMVHGLTHKWKQVLGYFLASGGTKAVMLKNIVCSAIDMISDIGGTVVAITCDQGANNRALFSNLGITVENPFFVHSSAKIFCFFDPPHLFKSVRNNLMKHDIQIRNKVAKWQHICDFFDIDSKQPIRLCPKLTNKHFHLTNFTKMKVSYACQVMSKSVAAAIMTHVSFKSLPPEATDTASFLETMDKLIDCFNSRTLLSKLKPHKAAVSSKSVHNQFLKDSLQWIKKWNVIGARSQLPCVYGLQVTISALLQLWDYLKTECSFQFLLTSRLNQDGLENLFSVVRQAGGCRDSPNAEQFGQSLRQCAIKSLLLAPKSANCVLDSDVFLASLSDPG